MPNSAKLEEYLKIEEGMIDRARHELRNAAYDALAAGDTDMHRRLLDIVGGLLFRRDSGDPRAEATANEMTSELVGEILASLAAEDMGQRERGRIFNVDGARINEVKKGLRTVENPKMKHDRSYGRKDDE